jgi:hypothetical protein
MNGLPQAPFDNTSVFIDFFLNEHYSQSGSDVLARDVNGTLFESYLSS